MTRQTKAQREEQRAKDMGMARGDLIDAIRAHFVSRQTLLRFEITLQNQIDAKRREMTRPPNTAKWTIAQANAALAKAPEVLLTTMVWEVGHSAAIKAHHGVRLDTERRLEGLARYLPAYPWGSAVRGFGALGLTLIVGACGDLGGYANPAKVWKRMGLAVLPDGGRQRRMAGVTREEAMAVGYSAERRSIMWVIGKSLIQGNRGGEYKTYYDREKARQLAKWPEPMLAKGRDGKEIDVRKSLADRRAQRHMEKRLLCDLWRAWRVADGMDPGRAWGEEAVQ